MKGLSTMVLVAAVFAADASTAPASGALFDELAQMDQQVFETAFVDCDAEDFRSLFTEDAEFYHDVTGATYGKDVWTLKGCPADDGVTRVLVPESLTVDPIKGYGAMQSGEHWFVEEGAESSTLARFVHLWRRGEDGWRISRVFSFDHQSLKPGQKRTETVDAELLATVKRLDDVVFEAGYNDCEIDTLATVVAEDLEFYHDQAGAMYGREAFLDSMENGICKLDYRARRELVEGSMRVFPLHDNGELYGAIQSGVHRFHAKYPGKAEHSTGIAKFASLWLLKGGDWKLSRVLSFDHEGLD